MEMEGVAVMPFIAFGRRWYALHLSVKGTFCLTETVASWCHLQILPCYGCFVTKTDSNRKPKAVASQLTDEHSIILTDCLTGYNS